MVRLLVNHGRNAFLNFKNILAIINLKKCYSNLPIHITHIHILQQTQTHISEEHKHNKRRKNKKAERHPHLKLHTPEWKLESHNNKDRIIYFKKWRKK